MKGVVHPQHAPTRTKLNAVLSDILRALKLGLAWLGLAWLMAWLVPSSHQSPTTNNDEKQPEWAQILTELLL